MCNFSSKKRPTVLLLAAVTGALAAVGLISACSVRKRRIYPDLPTVEHVVLERYVGVWYEIARLPNRFQKQCASNVVAQYTPAADGVRVRNSCKRPDGRVVTISGKAKVEPGSGNAKLRVKFFGLRQAPYWILALDRDYEWAMVGTPDRKYLWILSRAPQLSHDVQNELIARAAELGFAAENITMTQQAENVQYPSSYSQQS